MTKKNINPRPRVHKAVIKHIEKNMKQAIKDLKNKLSILEVDIIEDVYQAFGDEIDAAIEEAYNDGIEDGKRMRDNQYV